MSDNQAIPLIKNKKKSSVGKTRLKTTTPSLEAGGSPRSTPSPLTSPPSPTAVALEEDDDFTFPDDEGQRLLDESRVAGKLKDSSDRIRVLGVPLPKPLLYLLSAPAILFVLILIRPHSFFPSSTRITFSNGTDLFHPTTILISLDGFRPSYLTSHSSLLPNLLSLAESPIGLRAEYMLPIFPTITFPNHWAMMTGLYPAWSGIVANDFFAPDMSNEEFSRPAPVNDGQGGEKSGREFVYADPDKSWDSGWWWGEPMWGVVEKAGCKAANLMWPGPPVTSTGITPTYFVPFRDMSPSDKVEQIFHWLDHPLSQRPVFITAYFPEVDAAGHTAGPESEEVEGALRSMDNMVGGLMEGLEKRNLTGIVNVIIVSDHGEFFHLLSPMSFVPSYDPNNPLTIFRIKYEPLLLYHTMDQISIISYIS
ncbi:hypothetical protein M231_05366 [Tremella mesenterica]|uniref:Uncharacterized protein n=1 Tax=Tremella mesenterica TaxID=5217 RepID=A0A4Q1BIB1_TREME|nr:hypothetical protein M231_05366 [Tremella mesenterica]